MSKERPDKDCNHDPVNGVKGGTCTCGSAHLCFKCGFCYDCGRYNFDIFGV